MNCILLTGVTGMLGHFLLRDWLFAGQRIAVIVRDQRIASARHRVDQIVTELETTAQRFLPRPVVLAGDIHQPGLGLSATDARWVARNCNAILHSAASVKFYADECEDRYTVEPYLSNVVGTRNVLEFCRQAGIANFHHVSTAYVCGQQTGPAIEQPVGDVQFGNDYEASKVEAEELVRQASFLKSRTFLRPSIIVGDSKTGFASAFQGIYTTLRLGYLFIVGSIRSNSMEFEPGSIDSMVQKLFIESLGAQGDDQKNLVPADWVSSVIFEVVQTPKLHNQIYHITNPMPVSVTALALSMRDAAIQFLSKNTDRQSPLSREVLKPEGFRAMMDPYRAYFGNDPKFDSTHTEAIPSVKACPRIDHETLMKLWAFAIAGDFSPKKKSPSDAAPYDVERLLSEAFDRLSAPALDRPAFWATLQVNGPGGGIWQIGFNKIGTDWAASMFQRVDMTTESAVTYHINSRNLAALMNGGLNVEEAIYSGQLFAQSSDLASAELQSIAQELFIALQVVSKARSSSTLREATVSVFPRGQRLAINEKPA